MWQCNISWLSREKPLIYKSSHRRCYVEKCVLKNFANFSWNHLCWSLFLINFQALRPATLLKRDSDTGISLWNLRIFRNTYFEEYLRKAALNVVGLKLSCQKDIKRSSNFYFFVLLLLLLFFVFVFLFWFSLVFHWRNFEDRRSLIYKKFVHKIFKLI